MTQPLRITSRQNSRVKEAARLRESRERQRSGRFLIDGNREIERAAAAGVQFLEAFVREDVQDSAAAAAIGNAAAETMIVTREVYEKLAFGDRSDGIVVVAATPRRGLSDLQVPERPIIAVLEGLEKPGNVGAILRSADAAGVDAVIVADGRSDLYNHNTIRASVGTVFRANVCEASSAAAMEWIRDHGLTVVAARPDADRDYTEVDLSGGAAIVLGSEAEGLSDAWRGTGIVPVRLPMHGMADSLNVSTTAAVLFYEALRQRRG